MTAPYRRRQVGRERLGDRQPRFDGGLNTVSDESAMLDTQVREAINLRLNEYGALSKRSGVAPDPAVANQPLLEAVQGGYCWRQDSGVVQYLTVADGVLHVNGVAQSGTLSTTARVVFAQFRDATSDVVYIADGGALNKWDGATLTTNLAGTPNCTRIAVHNQRLWACVANEDSIYYSSLNNGDTMAVANQIIVRTFADEVVIGLASLGSSLLIFHRRGVSRLTGFGQDDITVSPEGITSDVGVICADAIVESDSVVFFLSDRGCYAASEGAVAPVGTPTTPDPLLPVLSAMNASQYSKVRGVQSRQSQEVLFFLPGHGIYSYHTILRAWCGPWDGPFLDCTELWQAVDAVYGAQPYIQMGTTNGDVLLVSTGSVVEFTRDFWSLGEDPVNGDSFEWQAQFHRMYFGDESAYKAFRWGYLTAIVPSIADVLVEWDVGDASIGTATITGFSGGTWNTSLTWDTSLRWGIVGSRNYRIPMGGGGYYVDVTLSSSDDGSFVLSRFSLEAFAMGRR